MYTIQQILKPKKLKTLKIQIPFIDIQINTTTKLINNSTNSQTTKPKIKHGSQLKTLNFIK